MQPDCSRSLQPDRSRSVQLDRSRSVPPDRSLPVPSELARRAPNLGAMDDRLEVATAGLLSIYLFLAISVADWLLLAPSLAALALAAWTRTPGACRGEPGYDRA